MTNDQRPTTIMFTSKQITQMADAARSRAMVAIRSAHSGHVGIALGAADIMTAIFANHLRFDPKQPGWPDRDRFVLSAGHASALLYSVLQLAGYDIPDLSGFRKFGTPLAGHPEYGFLPGVETSTGPLGQGLANAAGMALAAKMRAARGWGDEFKTYVLCSDGDFMEGVGQESVAFAGRYRLNNLIVFWDDNGISIDGPALTDLDLPLRMRAAGWLVMRVNGHKPAEINAAIEKAKKSKNKPVFIQANTTIGLGAPNRGTAAAHALTLNDAQLAALEQKFKSADGEKLWKEIEAKRGGPADKKVNIQSSNDENVERLSIDLSSIKYPLDPLSTREAGGLVLEHVVKNIPNIVGGSADLTESTFARPENMRDITPDDFSGNYMHYGVREHAMAAIMNGLSLCGFRPYGGTFLVFSDYMRPAMRLSAFMRQPVIYLLSHDSIALGEDGPTHQPIEHLTALRAIPNMNVLRPADMAEVAACWEIALSGNETPQCLILSRQKLPQIAGTSAAGVKRGGYIVKERGAKSGKSPQFTIIATGSEVSLAVEIQKILDANGVSARVVSMPSVEIFRLQGEDYKNRILAGTVVALEAGATFGWYEFADIVGGTDTFGASGDGASVYKNCGFDAAAIAEEILNSQKKH